VPTCSYHGKKGAFLDTRRQAHKISKWLPEAKPLKITTPLSSDGKKKELGRTHSLSRLENRNGPNFQQAECLPPEPNRPLVVQTSPSSQLSPFESTPVPHSTSSILRAVTRIHVSLSPCPLLLTITVLSTIRECICFRDQVRGNKNHPRQWWCNKNLQIHQRHQLAIKGSQLLPSTPVQPNLS
jgi:hypothetical protein